MRISVELDSYEGKDGRRCVQLVFVSKGRARRRLKIRVEMKHWDSKKQRVKFGHPNAGAHNRTIEAAIRDAEALVAERPSITPEALRDASAGSSMTFAEVAYLDLEEDPPRSWHTQRQRFQRIGQFNRAFPDIAAKDVDASVFARYKAVLMAQDMSLNSVATQLRTLRTIYNRVCARIGVAPLPVLGGLDAVERYGGVRSHLTAEEVATLEEYAAAEEGWKAKAVHMWLFSLYAGGIRWTDLCRLTEKNIENGRVSYVASKTRKAKNVPLFPEAAAIADIYSGGPTLFDMPTEPSRIAMMCALANKYLKIAAKECGITKKLHTHNARHTSAAFLFDKGIDDRVIMDILGVDAKAFPHYKASIKPELVDQAMHKVFGKHEAAPPETASRARGHKTNKGR